MEDPDRILAHCKPPFLALDQNGILGDSFKRPPYRPNLYGRCCSDWSSWLTGGLVISSFVLGVHQCVKREYFFSTTALVMTVVGAILHSRINHLKISNRRAENEEYYRLSTGYLQKQNKGLRKLTQEARVAKENAELQYEECERENEAIQGRVKELVEEIGAREAVVSNFRNKTQHLESQEKKLTIFLESRAFIIEMLREWNYLNSIYYENRAHLMPEEPADKRVQPTEATALTCSHRFQPYLEVSLTVREGQKEKHLPSQGLELFRLKLEELGTQIAILERAVTDSEIEVNEEYQKMLDSLKEKLIAIRDSFKEIIPDWTEDLAQLSVAQSECAVTFVV